MNEVDIAIIIVTAISCLFGVWRGLVKEVLSLLTWVAALLVARVYSEQAAGLLVNMIDNASGRYVTAFALLFVVVMMAGTLLNHLFTKLLTLAGLRPMDRVLGGLFGILRGFVIVLVILFITSVFVADSPRWQESRLIPYGMDIIEWSRIFIGDLDTLSVGQ